MNKAQWNTVILDDPIPQGEIERMIDKSYMLVVSKMTKKDQSSFLVHLFNELLIIEPSIR
ncbi:MmcQ/YjbR family DNA-binding protein [Thalassotalea atypica]|uniref:MmcQ/YjbR family DNA-binding protein n=1 Tax=Thalassotalea atypica TaxID=2054316 RepID=UPI003305AB23